MVSATAGHRYQSVISRILRPAARHGFETLRYGYSHQGRPLYAFRRTLDSRYTNLMIAAGTHGDEPAGIDAIAAFMRAGDLPAHVNLLIYPCINPDGLNHGTRENALGADLNRSFTNRADAEQTAREAAALLRSPALAHQSIDLLLNLHDDSPSIPTDFGNGNCPNGSYVYFNSIRAMNEDSVAAQIRRSWKSNGVEIASQQIIYGDRADDGIIDYSASSPNKTLRTISILDNAIKHQYAADAVTVETLTQDPLEKRVTTHSLAIEAAIRACASASRILQAA